MLQVCSVQTTGPVVQEDGKTRALNSMLLPSHKEGAGVSNSYPALTV